MSGIFLAFTNSKLTDVRTNLYNTLVKAGQHTFPSDISESINNFSEMINSASASLHIVGENYESSDITGISTEEKQLELAKENLKLNPNFKIFIWFPFLFNEVNDEKQRNFISQIRNNIFQGINFSNTTSAIQLVDDLRLSVKVEQAVEFNINETDIFLIYNQLDDKEADEVVDMLSDIVPVEKLNIVQDSDVDYSEYCSQQINKSKLAVVYFKESADWALPFAQQIWKKIGGASSHTPILLIGDEDPETNVNKKFKAPKVISLIVAGELIPLEIKVQFDKVLETIS